MIPILIIPGFMSSGLEVKESNLKPGWKGERIWINLQSLGFESMYFGDAQHQQQYQQPTENNNNNNNNHDNHNDDDVQAAIHRKYKSAWLEHMVLQKDMKSETNGIQIRAISGLEGVDYLSPGTLTNLVSYVFGPVITALQTMGGYSEPQNLQAAPYDWRIPPSQLELRDSYFTRTMKQVEELYDRNNNTPVIILCHSLGTKTAHYFLNFCVARQGGQAWVDKYIHTYLPVGGAHLGAPKAIRSVISGDKMGLDTFLNTEEALSFGRSLGSGPWLFPTNLPVGVPSSVYLRPQGVLEVLIIQPVNATKLVQQRTTMHKPDRYQLATALVQEDGTKRIVTTPFCFADASDTTNFSSEKLYFATTSPPAVGDEYTLQHSSGGRTTKVPFLQVLLQEPGISVAKQERSNEKFNPLKCCCKVITCCWIFDLVYRIMRFLSCIVVQGVTLSADAISRAVGGSTTLAMSERYYLSNERIWNGKTVIVELELYHKDDIGRKEGGCCCCFCCWCFGRPVQPRTSKLTLQLKWTPYNKAKSFRQVCSPIAQQANSNDDDDDDGKKGALGSSPELVITKKNDIYQAFSGYEIIEREGLDHILQGVKNVYDDDDELGPRTTSSIDPPPVKRVHAIYGINLPTEVGGIYKRKDTCLSDNRLKNLYRLDTSAQVAQESKESGYIAKNGIIMETKKTKQQVAQGRQVSGDGTVPYWSLQHVRTWQGPCTVSVVELDRAEHREILADSRFHKALLEYCQKASSELPPTSTVTNVEDNVVVKQAHGANNNPPAVPNQEVVKKEEIAKQDDETIGYSIMDACNPCG